MPESIRKKEHSVRYNPGDALSGDQILIECRKQRRWQTVRGSEQHHYFSTIAEMNAYAVISKKFKNLQK